MLRVIAGELGGRRLWAPSGLRTRPTAERVREALFSILGPPPAAACTLDLYAGSGALGIEALSRGAARAVFVEHDAAACRTLAKNLRSLALAERAAIVPRPVRQALPQLVQAGPFQWIFADPPYKSDEPAWLLAALRRLSLLAEGGRLIVERAASDADELLGALSADAGLELIDRRRYGDTALLFFAAAGEAP